MRQGSDPIAGPPTLRVERLRFGYRAGRPVIHDVAADLRPGRVTALLGPNAAGKSTLLRLMLGQLEPWAGGVWLGEGRVDAIPPRARARRISYVPQRGAVSFAFTARQVVAMGRFAAGAGGGRDDAVDAALRAAELLDVADAPFNELSGGTQQRVLLARALAQAASGGAVMLLDEPGSNMDLRHVEALMGELRRAADRGLAVLIVLHDINLAARHADDVWLMDAGRLAAVGPRDDVMTRAALEPVYGVALDELRQADRPVFLPAPA